MRIIKTILLTLLVLFSIATASALSTDLSDNKLKLGSETQEASNFNRDTFGEYVTGQITFDSTVISLLEVVPISPYVHSSDTVVNNINVTAGEPTTNGNNSVVTISARVPENLPAVDTTGEAASFQVATLKFSDGNDTVNVALYMQRKNYLEFKDIHVKYGADEETKLRNGKTLDELKPGDSLIFDFEIENTYSNSQDVEMDDVTIYIEDDNNDLDIDEDEDLGSIREGDEETETISVELEDDLDEDDYRLYLKVIGRDDYGARHGEVWVIELQVDKEKDEISIRRLDMNPDTIDVCQDNYVTFTVNIENTGRHDQDEAAVEIYNSNLNYRDRIDDIEIDEDDSTTKTFIVKIPETANPGVYRFVIKTFYDADRQSDERDMTLYVRNCDYVIEQPPVTGGEDEEEEEPVDKVEVIGYASDITIAQPPTPSKVVKESDEIEEEILTTRILVLILIVVVLLVILIALIGRRS